MDGHDTDELLGLSGASELYPGPFKSKFMAMVLSVIAFWLLFPALFLTFLTPTRTPSLLSRCIAKSLLPSWMDGSSSGVARGWCQYIK